MCTDQLKKEIQKKREKKEGTKGKRMEEMGKKNKTLGNFIFSLISITLKESGWIFTPVLCNILYTVKVQHNEIL